MASYTVARSRAELNILRLSPDGLNALPSTMDAYDPSMNFDQNAGRLMYVLHPRSSIHLIY